MCAKNKKESSDVDEIGLCADMTVLTAADRERNDGGVGWIIPFNKTFLSKQPSFRIGVYQLIVVVHLQVRMRHVAVGDYRFLCNHAIRQPDTLWPSVYLPLLRTG
ncbi:hypothetical protein CDAR_278471 [Caerostris darwini]|uniref:Uncharacterized protein n=1 Tax=Caerostris darwini TaxID=1538125 RepID=A0AAV4WR40_9ARAC|nr:hypothetical protein CDAR_278471 [Caerostris darwini]